ncbi:unnamed protein product [Urochloa humidicola]
MARSFTVAAAAFLLVVATMAVSSAHAGRALSERHAGEEAGGNAAVRLPGLDFLIKLGEGVLTDATAGDADAEGAAAFVPKKAGVPGPGIHRYKRIPVFGP